MSADDAIDRAELVREIQRGGWWRLGFVSLTVAILSVSTTSCLMQPRRWNSAEWFIRLRNQWFQTIQSTARQLPVAQFGLQDFDPNATLGWSMTPPDQHVRSVLTYQDWNGSQRWQMSIQRRSDRGEQPIDIDGLGNYLVRQMQALGPAAQQSSSSSSHSGALRVPGTNTLASWDLRRWESSLRSNDGSIHLHITITIFPGGDTGIIEWSLDEHLAR